MRSEPKCQTLFADAAVHTASTERSWSPVQIEHSRTELEATPIRLQLGVCRAEPVLVANMVVAKYFINID